MKNIMRNHSPLMMNPHPSGDIARGEKIKKQAYFIFVK